ncbi:MAG: penicillin-binding transpeptidase domain-containing protein [Flavobacteriales bacterium]
MRNISKQIIISSLIGFGVFFSCSSPNHEVKSKPTVPIEKQFQTLLDTGSVKGSILIFDVNKSKYYSNDLEYAKTSHLPASTFKIPNSLIALELGIVETDTSTIFWDGKKRRFKIWEQDLSFRDAFHFSCVPCYQEIAAKVGVERMIDCTNKFQFGKMVLDSNTLTNFWLEGNSGINQFQQIEFLQSFEGSQLPVSERTESIMKRMMLITKNDSIELRGKTGWSNFEKVNNGWYVGYVKRQENTYYFATNIEPENGLKLNTFAERRKTITYDALNIVFDL